MSYTLEQGTNAYLLYVGSTDEPVTMHEFFAKFDPETFKASADQPLVHLLDQRRSHRKKTDMMRAIEEEYGEQIEVILQEWYELEYWSVREIAKELRISAPSVRNWLRRFNIPIRSVSEGRLQKHGGRKPSGKELQQWYLEKQLNCVKIAERCGVNYTTIPRWLEEADIEIRNPSETRLVMVGGRRPEAEDLERLYVTERQTLRQIGALYDISATTVKNYLGGMGITRRTRWGDSVAGLPDNDALAEQYATGTSMKELARKYGVSPPTVKKRLQKMGVRIRGKGEQRLFERGIVRPPAEELRRRYVDEEESWADLTRSYGTGAETMRNWLHEADIELRSRSEACLLHREQDRKAAGEREWSYDEGTERYLAYVQEVGQDTAVGMETFFLFFDPETLQRKDGHGPLRKLLRRRLA